MTDKVSKTVLKWNILNSIICSWVCRVLPVLFPPDYSVWYLKRQDFLVASPADVCVVVCACVSFHQNRLVDVCEKMQLQALRIERFIEQTLTDKERKLQVRNMHRHC